MQGLKGVNGLTDGISSRFLRRIRTNLVPDLVDKAKLHERLEELLVFEILKDGGTGYHRFSVRTLYRHVLNAIKGSSTDIPEIPKSPKSAKKKLEVLDKMALALDIQGPRNERSPENNADGKPATNQSTRLSFAPISEGAVIEPRKSHENPEVTYRERLGGFLHPRDMRKLVTPFSASNLPELIVRRHAMLLNFDPLRAIILRDRLLVLVPDGADSILVELERRMRGESHGATGGDYGSNISLGDTADDPSIQSNIVKNVTSVLSKIPSRVLETFETSKDRMDGKPDAKATRDTSVSNTHGMDGSASDESLGSNVSEKPYNSLVDNEWEELEGREWIDLPFELQAVDAVLHSVCAILADDAFDLQLGANAMIEDLLAPGADFGDHAQEMLRGMKNSVGEMTSRVNGFCRALDMVLEDYEDMTLMNLGRLLTHPERFIQPVPQSILEEESDEPELILEAHLQRGNTLANVLTLVQGQINTTEDFAVRKSDTIRNRLLYINLITSIMSLAVALASFVGSIFGMNVINHFEDNPNTFRVIVFTTVAGGLLFVVFVVVLVRRLGALPALTG